METRFTLHPGPPSIAVVPDDAPRLASLDAARELLANAYFQGAEGLLLPAACLPDGFFDLSTRVAGELLQSFSNYRMRAAIVLDAEPAPSSALQAFVTESNRGRLIRFTPTHADALAFLAPSAD